MHLDSLERLINSADSSVFPDLCLRYLKLSGYQEPVLTDGKDDLGRDISVWHLGVEEPIAIQVSVQKNRWQQKAVKDAVHVKDRLGITNFTYMTNIRVSGHDEQELVNQLWAEHHIAARFVDSRVLASFFQVEKRSGDVLEALGMEERESAYGSQLEGPSLKEDLAYAYAFFGSDVDTFRRDVVERSIVAYLTRKPGPHKRDVTEAAVCDALGLDPSRVGLASSRIDYMLQKGSILSEEGELTVSPEVVRDARSVRALRSRQWRELQDQISNALANAGVAGSKLEKVTLEVSDTAGALIMSSADTAKQSVLPGSDPAPVRKNIEVKLRKLTSRLQAAGIAPEDALSLMRELTTLISESEIGQTLLAGYLFMSLIDLSETNLLRALGGKTNLEVILDASVAIPILASLLYEAHDSTFFRTSVRAYEQAAQFDVQLTLPYDYLEEAASHLIDGARLYEPVREAGEDLRYSQNAFVAHFATLTAEGKYKGSFFRYAESFGMTRIVRSQTEFRGERDRVMQSMQRQLAQYGIGVTKLGRADQARLAEAESAIAFTAQDLGIERTKRLLEHDARTVAALASRAAEGESLIFCTWDRLHLQLAAGDSFRAWEAMNPSMLADLLALASPSPGQMTGPAIEIAIALDQAEARLGSEIWDELVRIERSELYDADLMTKAKAFKQQYVTKSLEERKAEPLALAWTKWKALASEANQG